MKNLIGLMREPVAIHRCCAGLSKCFDDGRSEFLVKYKEEEIPLGLLRSCQREVDEEKVQLMTKALTDGDALPLPTVVNDEMYLRYYVLDGNHRINAAILAGQEAVKCNVLVVE